MSQATRGRSRAEFNLSQMSLEQLAKHIRACHATELSCKGNKGLRYWKRHKDEAQAELDRSLEAQQRRPS
jgi:hypothetical protein